MKKVEIKGLTLYFEPGAGIEANRENCFFDLDGGEIGPPNHIIHGFRTEENQGYVIYVEADCVFLADPSMGETSNGEEGHFFYHKSEAIEFAVKRAAELLEEYKQVKIDKDELLAELYF